MSTQVALALARRGWSILPVGPNKAPLTPHGVDDATTDPETIATWWTVDFPDAGVAVATDPSGLLVLDVDRHGAKDGFASLAQAGIVPDASIEYPTPNGGRHVVYAAPPSMPLARSTDYQGLIGIDRLAGRGYFVWHGGPELTDADLAPAPTWLVGDTTPVRATPDVEYPDGIDAWLTQCPPGPMDSFLSMVIGDWSAGDFGHVELVERQTFLVAEGVRGTRGVPDALQALRSLWLRAPWDDAAHAREFDVALAGAVRKFGAPPAEPTAFDIPATLDTPLPASSPDAAVAREADRLRVQRAALRLVQQEEAADAPSINLVTLTELWDRPSPEWRAADFLPQNTLALVAGAPGVGKSFLALDLALSVATGKPFLTSQAVRPGRVLYCAGEGVDGFPVRIRAWSQSRNSIPENDTFVLADAGVNLSDEGSVRQLEQLVADNAIDLVIFDTFRKLSRVESEDRPVEVGLALRNAERVRRAHPGCSAVVVHHTNKGGAINGSLAFLSEPDVVWTLKGGDGEFALTLEKGKDMGEAGLPALRLSAVGDSCVVAPAAPIVGDVDYFGLLEKGREYSRAELGNIIPGSERTQDRAIDAALGLLRLRKLGRGRYLRTEAP